VVEYSTVIAGKTRLGVASRGARNRLWTYDELTAELPESNLPTELWDGELTVAPAPSFQHQEISLRFYKLLDAWVGRKRCGKVVAAPVDMVLTSRRSVQPDVLFVSTEQLGIIKENVRGAADLVAEVLSPGTRRRDRFDKRDLYEQHGIREYWIIDPEAQTVEVLSLEAGEYKLAGRWRERETARSRLLEGFAVPVPALFSGA